METNNTKRLADHVTSLIPDDGLQFFDLRVAGEHAEIRQLQNILSVSSDSLPRTVRTGLGATAAVLYLTPVTAATAPREGHRASRRVLCFVLSRLPNARG